MRKLKFIYTENANRDSKEYFSKLYLDPNNILVQLNSINDSLIKVDFKKQFNNTEDDNCYLEDCNAILEIIIKSDSINQALNECAPVLNTNPLTLLSDNKCKKLLQEIVNIYCVYNQNEGLEKNKAIAINKTIADFNLVFNGWLNYLDPLGIARILRSNEYDIYIPVLLESIGTITTIKKAIKLLEYAIPDLASLNYRKKSKDKKIVILNSVNNTIELSDESLMIKGSSSTLRHRLNVVAKQLLLYKKNHPELHYLNCKDYIN